MVETQAEAPTQDLINSLLHARRTVRLMAQGIMPAYEAASQAAATLRTLTQSDREFRQTLRKTGQVLGAITMGIAPSQSHCLEADQQLERLIDSLKNGQGQGLWQAESGTPDQLRKHMLILGTAVAGMSQTAAAEHDGAGDSTELDDDDSSRSSDRIRM
jgi:hypothetical protein